MHLKFRLEDFKCVKDLLFLLPQFFKNCNTFESIQKVMNDLDLISAIEDTGGEGKKPVYNELITQ